MGTDSEISGTDWNALRENTSFLNDVLNCIKDGISILDPDLNVLFVNKTMQEWYAHHMPLVGKKCFEAYHGRDAACEICPSLETLQEGKPAMEIVPYTTQEGVKGWLELFTFPLMDSETGRIKGVIEHVRDITKRKQAEEALRESEERFHKLSDASFEGIAIHDGMRILAANKTFADMLGYELSTIAGRSLDFVSPDNQDLLAIEGGPYETECLQRSGKTFICQIRGKDIPYQGQTVRVNAIRDITERMIAEAMLEKYAHELKQSNRQLEEFAAVASHDLQSPLISVLSALKLLDVESRGKLDQESESYLVYARETISNMLTVIRSLLDYSRVGASERKFKSVDMGDALDQSIANLLSNIAETGAMVTFDELPHISGDRGLLTLLFQNLIANAISFRGEAPSRIHVSSERYGDMWLFSVKDNGIGIAPVDIDRIFDIYHSLKAKEEHRGTGIGLATCRKIVALHGGRIWAESEPGKGSTFYFALPYREIEQEALIEEE